MEPDGENVQKLLTSGQLITHYNPSLPIHMAMDTSVYGVGAVISHALSNGSERPIAFASHTLTGSERNYTQKALSFQCEEVLPKRKEDLLDNRPQTPYNHTGAQEGQTISGSRSISVMDYSFNSNTTK